MSFWVLIKGNLPIIAWCRAFLQLINLTRARRPPVGIPFLAAVNSFRRGRRDDFKTSAASKMGYDALKQMDHDQDHHEHQDRFEDYDGSTTSASPFQPRPCESTPLSMGLFLENNRENNTNENQQESTGFSHLVNSIASRARSTKATASYDMVEGFDDCEERDSPGPSAAKHQGSSPTESFVISTRPRPSRPRLNAPATTAEEVKSNTGLSPRSISREPIVRTASGRSLVLRHPTPDLQVLQGAYTGNIQHLERTAERLSMTSSIDDAIRELHSEQKRNDSRRSSLSNRSNRLSDSHLDQMPSVTRQFSNSSIMETNNLARSGGYSPAGFMMSPKGSFTTGGRGRSASKSSRFGSRPEPELEGRPLDSFVSLPMPESTSPFLSRSASIDEQEPSETKVQSHNFDEPSSNSVSAAQPSEAFATHQISLSPEDDSVKDFSKHVQHLFDKGSNTPTQPAVDILDGNAKMEGPNPEPSAEERPATSASTTTFDQAQLMFQDFDGVHSAPQPIAEDGESENSQRRVTSGDQQYVAGSDMNSQRRLSSGNRLSMARPQSYADPSTGQQMVYYPAPVPMMLNLPQKLSKMPSSMARNKRRTQVLSSIPQAARQSAIWLPDVLETEDEPDLPENDEAQQLEYVPQHQRMSMGGRRLTQDIQHLPPQLRANAFFELQGPSQVVELKEQSAVATLDSILDASAHAPVSAFTDHAFAGHLGAEVYGRANIRNSKSSTQLLQVEPTPKKRTSSFNLLRGRRASSSDLLESENEKKRANTISDIRAGKIIRDPLEDEEEDTSAMAASDAGDLQDEREEEEELYRGAPTTLLAELQLRKQQAKMRTRPVASAYPNGIRSTLLELDAVAQVEQKSRKQKRIHLAWEDPDQAVEDDSGDDEDVPLALLYAKKSQVQEPNRPLGLMERRDMEDNEPLSRRRERLQGKPPMMPRASTMMNLAATPPEEEGETLAQRVRRLKESGDTATGLPSARPVSGDFAAEMMSQFGGDLTDPKGKGKGIPTSPAPEEEETLGQRRKRLQAEREARALEVGNPGEAQERPKMQTRRSMADILSAHPATGASRVPSYGKEPSSNGLLGLHEKQKQQRASTMFNLDAPQLPSRQANAGGFKAGMYNDGQGGIIPPAQPQMQRQSGYNMFASPTAGFHQQQFPQPSLGMGYNAFGGNQMMMPFANPYAMGGYGNGMQMNGMNMGYMQPNPMAGMNMMQMGVQPLNQGQIDMVERWRQSVMQ